MRAGGGVPAENHLREVRLKLLSKPRRSFYVTGNAYVGTLKSVMGHCSIEPVQRTRNNWLEVRRMDFQLQGGGMAA